MNEIIEKIISREATINCTIQIGGLAARYRFVRYKSWIENNYIHIKEQNQMLDIPVRKLEDAVYELRNGMLIGRIHMLAEQSVSVTFCMKQNSASSKSGRTQMRHQLSANS